MMSSLPKKPPLAVLFHVLLPGPGNFCPKEANTSTCGAEAEGGGGGAGWHIMEREYNARLFSEMHAQSTASLCARPQRRADEREKGAAADEKG